MTNTRSLVHELEKLFLDFNISSLDGRFIIQDGRIRVEYADVTMDLKEGCFLYAETCWDARPVTRAHITDTPSRDSLSPELLQELLEHPHTVMLLAKHVIVEIVQRAAERDGLLEEQRFVGSMIGEIQEEVRRLRAEVENRGIAVIRAPSALKTSNGPIEYFMEKGVAVDAVRSLRKVWR